MTILDRIVETKRREAAAAQTRMPPARLREAIEGASPARARCSWARRSCARRTSGRRSTNFSGGTSARDDHGTSLGLIPAVDDACEL